MTTQDAMGTWMIECCDRAEATNSGQATNSTIGDLYKSFAAWCGLNGEYVFSRRRFSDALENRGYEARRYGGLYQVQGLRLKQPAMPTNSDYMQD
jgi:phage/plasmid-associated DNA primase